MIVAPNVLNHPDGRQITFQAPRPMPQNPEVEIVDIDSFDSHNASLGRQSISVFAARIIYKKYIALGFNPQNG